MKKSGEKSDNTTIGIYGPCELTTAEEISTALFGTLQIFADDIFCLYDRAEAIGGGDVFLTQLGKLFSEIINGTGNSVKREKLIQKISKEVGA